MLRGQRRASYMLTLFTNASEYGSRAFSANFNALSSTRWQSSRALCISREKALSIASSCSYFRCRANSYATSHGPELFEYTSGRWLYNETARLSERRTVFNINELKKAVAKCLQQPDSEVRGIVKLAEGGFNRVFQLTMADGTEVLARTPYSSTQPKHYAVASEVATLKLVRSHGVPVPKVLGYSADPDNSVGAEFIIMEKLPGQPLGDQWFTLSENQRLKVISEVVRIEAKLAKIDLPAYGSVYHKHDLPADAPHTIITPASDNEALCVGPDASLRWWYEERESLHVERGPHSCPTQLLSRVAEKELAWMKAHGSPRLPFERAYRECMNYENTPPEEHIDSLEKFLRIVPCLVPQEARLHRPVLRHPDLQPNNIFFSADFDIIGIIDWQHCSVLPQFLAAGIPNYFQNYHDDESLRSIPPQLPPNFDELDEEDKLFALEQFRRRHLHFFYVGFTERFNPAHFEALSRRTDLLTRKVFTHAGEPWEANNIPLRSDLIHITQVWRELLEDNGHVERNLPLCPITFAETDVQRTIGILEKQEETDTQLASVRDAIGISTDGWMPNDQYEDTVERARLIKEQGLESLDTEEEREMTAKHWPFDDNEAGEIA